MILFTNSIVFNFDVLFSDLNFKCKNLDLSITHLFSWFQYNNGIAKRWANLSIDKKCSLLLVSQEYDGKWVTPLILGHCCGMEWQETNAHYTLISNPRYDVGGVVRKRGVMTMFHLNKKAIVGWNVSVSRARSSTITTLCCLDANFLKNARIFLFGIQTQARYVPLVVLIWSAHK